MRKVVVLLSGGMDSGVLCATLRESVNNEIHGLSLRYGSKHNDQELYCARQISEMYCKTYREFSCDLSRLLKSNLLVGGEDIPDGHYAEKVMEKTVVPFRNGILLSMAAGYAESIGASEIFIASHAGDHFIYPDCRPVFNRAMGEAIFSGTDEKVKLVAPFHNMTKREIGVLGNTLHFPFSKSWSCYKGEEFHCGTCGTCVERKEALEGFDSTTYLSLEGK